MSTPLKPYPRVLLLLLLLLQMSGMQVEHTDALNRKNLIEKRKEEAERKEQDKTREEAR